jgi:hypothetical protein
MMMHDRYRVEDLDTRLEDHAVDALRYMEMAIAGRLGREPASAAAAEQRSAVLRDSQWARGW